MSMKRIEFSPGGNGNDSTGSTPETIRDGSQPKRTSLTERFSAMVWMRPKDREEVINGTGKRKTFETVSAIITNNGDPQRRKTKHGSYAVTRKSYSDRRKNGRGRR